VQYPRAILLAAFAHSRLAYAAAGIRFDLSPLVGGQYPAAMQLLDARLLQTRILASIWDLHSQPPLYNLASGLLLDVPRGWRDPVAATAYLGFGLVIVLCSFALMVELRVPTGAALLVGLVIVADPSFVLNENWYSYGYPTAALLALGALCLVRFIRTRRWPWGAGFFAASATVVMLDSVFQYVWLVAVVVVVFAAFRRGLRVLLAVAVVPLLVVGLWAVKDAVRFDTYTTSSWLGMNLTKTTLRDLVRHKEVASLEGSHVLSALALVYSFGPIKSYVPRWVKLPHTGSPALDETRKSDGTPNFNNLAYIALSQQYLTQDLAFIRHEPRQFALTVIDASKLATVPPDEYEFLAGNRTHIAGWARVYDAVVRWQPTNDSHPAGYAIYLREAPGAAQLSYGYILSVLLTVGGGFSLAWRWRRHDPGGAAALVFIGLSVAYVLITTSVIEFAENERYAMDLGPLPLVGSAVVIAAVVRHVRRGRSTVSTPGAVLPETAEAPDSWAPDSVLTYEDFVVE
jgi:hypothetical protein